MNATRLAFYAGVLDVALAVGLGAISWWLGVTQSPQSQDGLARPVILLALYATPGVVAILAAKAATPSLLVGAALPLIPLSFLSWGGLTIPFLVPALLLIYAAWRFPRVSEPASSQLAHVSEGIAVVVLVFVAAWAFLREFPISASGATVSIAALASAIGVAGWSARRPDR